MQDSFEEQIAQKQALLAQLNPGVEFQSTIQQPTTPIPVQFRYVQLISKNISHY